MFNIGWCANHNFSVLCLIYFLNILIPDFGISTAILNTRVISHRWCKLNFEPSWGQVKSRYFSERTGAWIHYFYFLYIFRIICRKLLWQRFRIKIWIYYYLLNGIGLVLDLDKSCSIRKYLALLQTTLTFGFANHT